MIDMHCHVLYDVDDGSKSEEQSMEMLRAAESVGFKGIVLTPHYMSYTHFISPVSENRKRHRRLNQLIKREGLNLRLYLGNEVFYEPDLLPDLERGEFTTLNKGSYFLVETMRHDANKDHFLDFLYRIQIKGYETIVAHPERYDFVQDDPNVLLDYLDRGNLLQVNALSLIGFYGKYAQKTAEIMLDCNMAQFLSSDAHMTKAYELMPKALDRALEIVGPRVLKRLMLTNPTIALGAKGNIVVNPTEY
ncbi:MAG: capsular biosynthesis protein [Eubacteriaceae bacterium]|jgi:protein-tyrosine phosphatase|nr:capsular biosynthesis protein [Eubacteriaceae bacterium]